MLGAGAGLPRAGVWVEEQPAELSAAGEAELLSAAGAYVESAVRGVSAAHPVAGVVLQRPAPAPGAAPRGVGRRSVHF